jgi:hypothetical protein
LAFAPVDPVPACPVVAVSALRRIEKLMLPAISAFRATTQSATCPASLPTDAAVPTAEKTWRDF